MKLNPIVVEVGRQARKQIKRLKNNKGPLLEQIEAAVRSRFPLSIPSGNGGEKKLIPVVLIFRRKPRRKYATLKNVPDRQDLGQAVQRAVTRMAIRRITRS